MRLKGGIMVAQIITKEVHSGMVCETCLEIQRLSREADAGYCSGGGIWPVQRRRSVD